jgi:hypothetical protein
MDDGRYQGRYKGNTYTLNVQNGVGTVEGIEGEFASLTAAARAVKSAVSGRPMRARGPQFWSKVDLNEDSEVNAS